MKLHRETTLFSQTIRAASQQSGIREVFVEKDYWITLVLSRLAKSSYAAEAVFKGGTSLSKAYGLLDRFSEDVDIAIISKGNKTGNEIRTVIRTIEKEITADMTELQVEGVTSKGSRFRKSVFEYAAIDAKNKDNKLIVEVNSFANPFPYRLMPIRSFVFDFLRETGNEQYIEQYELAPFEINVLDKGQTMLEKMASLIRFSFAENPAETIAGKIRHFYDLYFLMKDPECAAFAETAEFRKRFNEIIAHDREIFDEPAGWQVKAVGDSPLIKDFGNTWDQLKAVYKTELTALAYTAIPGEKEVGDQFTKLIKWIQ